MNLPYITADATGPKHLVVKLSRAKLEALVEGLVDRSMAPVKTALNDAGLKAASDIEDVVLMAVKRAHAVGAEKVMISSAKSRAKM
ncbi:MAG: Hsp70 family protein [Pseudomonadales bacterium]